MKKIRNNLIFILIIIVIYLLFTFNLPYYIEGPGGLINLNDRYKVENEYKAKGSLNMTYVSEYKATIPFYIYSKLNKDYDIYKKETIIPSNETEKDSNFRGKIMLKEATDNAIIIAYQKAGKTCEIISSKIVIIYIDENARTNLKIGDEIISVNDTKVSNKAELKKIISNYNVGDKIIFKVKTKENKIKEKYGYLNNDKVVGILFSYDRKLVTNPNIEIQSEKDEYGPSGGLITTLSIYNKLVKEDITHGKKISGTGTIEEDGTVGEIDGVKYKLKGAVKNKADVFLVPAGNYKEAQKIKDKYNYNIKIVKVKNIDDALEYLKKEE